jgi:hypothetical protein
VDIHQKSLQSDIKHEEKNHINDILNHRIDL